MSETLASLHRAIVANPLDHTIRLVYADALDETGVPEHVARAEFIRAQIEMTSGAYDVHRLGVLTKQCEELFDAHWLAWWAPVVEAAGLPAPHVPARGLRERLAKPRHQQSRTANWPYTGSIPDPSIHLPSYGLSFRFVSGFPEEVRFQHFSGPEEGPELIHRWGEVIPLVRLSVSPGLSVTEWESVNGPHLARLTELSLDTLLEGVAPVVAASPALARLVRLTVNPSATDREVVCAAVASPVWESLKVLCFSGRLSPEGIHDLARACTLRNLDELELGIGTPGLLGSPVIEAAGAILQTIIPAMAALQRPRWAEFGPAFEALARADWVRNLRVLRISGHSSGLLGVLGERFHGRTLPAADPIPDKAVLTLASALRADKLERLVLPAAVISPPAREALTTRMGGKVVFM